MDLPTSSSLKIYDGEGLTAPLVFSLTKTPEDPIYISQKQSVRIVMSTDHHEYAKYRGFQLKYKQGIAPLYSVLVIEILVYTVHIIKTFHFYMYIYIISELSK